MKQIKVVARKRIEYRDDKQQLRFLKEETPFSIIVLKAGMLFNDGKGVLARQTHEQYLGVFKHGSSFVLPSEFKTVD